VLSAAIFVFVGVDSNHFRYVLDFEVTVQILGWRRIRGHC